MIDKKILSSIAEQIKNYISLEDTDHYFEETKVNINDFIKIDPTEEFGGDIFAIDGSNGVIFDMNSIKYNLIRAGYTVYNKRCWKKTIAFDKIFKSDPDDYQRQFTRDLIKYFNINTDFLLAKTELDRLSTYYRELQEYIVLSDAISEARKGDLVLYDGDFAYWTEPFKEVLEKISIQAENKDVDLVAISKSSTFSWGKEYSKPFVLHTGRIGSGIIPDYPWYIELSKKNIKPDPNGKNWNGTIYVIKLHQDSDFVFRLDVPYYVSKRINAAFGHLVLYSNSAECLGYPHALFRAHQDIKITYQERKYIYNLLMNELSRIGVNDLQVQCTQDYHNILEMKQGRRLI
jgi:hypothetical protein